MKKHLATWAGLALTGLFVVFFFTGRSYRELGTVASRVGMSYDDLMALGPRVASQTGATLGTSRQVVYLLACSGVPTPVTMEAQARQAATLVEQKRLSGREAVGAVLTGGPALPSSAGLSDC